MVKSMGPLRAYSCRPMERMIGKYKRLSNARIAVGENFSNIIERLAYFAYLEDTGIACLDSPTVKPLYRDDSFQYHPSGIKTAPQLWDLSKNSIDLRSPNELIAGVPVGELLKALEGYKKRMNKPGMTTNQTSILPAKRLWCDSQVISSSLYATSHKNIKRSSEYVMFESNHLK